MMLAQPNELLLFRNGPNWGDFELHSTKPDWFYDATYDRKRSADFSIISDDFINQ